MSVRLVCRACGKRLKLPDGAGRKPSARCPKCLAAVDLTAALEEAAYQPTVTIPVFASAPARAERAPDPPRDDDPLPYPVPRPSAPPKPTTPPPLPAPQPPPSGEVLSLDDDDAPAPPAEPDPPFRVPVRVRADSFRQVTGPCFAVFLPHGLFLEHEPTKPFLYAPVGSVAEAPAAGELVVALPDGRAVVLGFVGGRARALARDTVAFLAGERPVPVAREYGRKWWVLGAALIFALGLAVGPLVLARTADLGWEFGLKVGAGFALLGFVTNAAVVALSRWSVPAQVGAMAGACVLFTGLFLFGVAAYTAGRQRAVEEARSEGAATGPVPPPAPPVIVLPPEPPARPPSHLDRAKKNGSSALEDGPAEVTALALTPDGTTIGIGFADGTTRLWPLDQPTFDPMLPGPKADGPVSRVQFDSRSVFVFAHAPTGVFAAPRIGTQMTAAKLPGAPVAVVPEPDGDRVRFAAVRGGTLQLRAIAATFVQNPPKGKGVAVPGKGDEVTPLGVAKDPAKPPATTFFAWAPGGRLMAGQADGSVQIWSNPLKPEPTSRDHKAAVRAWAACPKSGDFATGDDQGHVGVWSAAGGKPVVTPVLAAPVTGLSFNATGTRLLVSDGSGWLVVWDVATAKALHRVRRPTAVRALAYGPTDDVVLLAAGKTVEVWWVPELLK